MKLTYRSTMLACYNGYVTQAICINLAPLLYLIFQRQFALSLGEISVLIAANFLVQLAIDLIASFFSKQINLRFCAVFAHLMSVIGLCGLSVFPHLLPPFAGLILAEACLGIGGGFTEVMISPLMEACPTEGKSGNMSLLHSFYCWGQAGVVLLASLFFALFPSEHSWYVLPFLFALVPLAGTVAFCIVPVYYLPADKKKDGQGASLLSNSLFWSFLLMMFCAGAAEMVMSQWASSFAESALGVPKSVGDLAGPCLFAVMMGIARALYGKFSNRIALEPLMLLGCLLCMASYLLAAFVAIPAVAFFGCALCGFSVGIFWPGLISRATVRLPQGGISMFALLAVAGDIGCLAGPSIAGSIADLFGGELRWAFCFAIAFPLINFIALFLQNKKKKGETK
ncbi:MAG: MFS transporter [Clostridia bacterium]|nr:MFS transporter [Clostridia bacterium]